MTDREKIEKVFNEIGLQFAEFERTSDNNYSVNPKYGYTGLAVNGHTFLCFNKDGEYTGMQTQGHEILNPRPKEDRV